MKRAVALLAFFWTACAFDPAMMTRMEVRRAARVQLLNCMSEFGCQSRDFCLQSAREVCLRSGAEATCGVDELYWDRSGHRCGR